MVVVIAWENTIQLGDLYLDQYPPAYVDELSAVVLNVLHRQVQNDTASTLLKRLSLRTLSALW